MTEYEERLRSLAINDEGFVRSVLGMEVDSAELCRLDPKTHALVRLAALLAVDAAPSSYQESVDAAFAAGASIDEVVGTAIAIAPTVGLARVVSAAPELALALGYDVEAALEAPRTIPNDVPARPIPRFRTGSAGEPCAGWRCFARPEPAPRAMPPGPLNAALGGQTPESEANGSGALPSRPYSDDSGCTW